MIHSYQSSTQQLSRRIFACMATLPEGIETLLVLAWQLWWTISQLLLHRLFRRGSKPGCEPTVRPSPLSDRQEGGSSKMDDLRSG